MTAPAPERQRLRILLVEDDHNSRECLLDMLLLEGHAVDAFANGPRALAAATTGAFDVLLTDLVMPEMTGLELISAVRRIDPAVRCFVMTGHPNTDDVDVEWISKPIDFDELVATLGRVVGPAA